MSLQGIKKIIKPHWTAGAVFNIHLELASGSVYATSVVLWSCDGSLGIECCSLMVYLSDGTNGPSYYMNYEYEESRPAPPVHSYITAGYYRFMTDRCEYNGETIYFPEIWTDWYYINGSTVYRSGVLQ